MIVFIDTGAFIARFVARDRHHRKALKAWKELSKRSWRCFTSNFVLDETFTLLARRSTYPFAVERARALMMSETLTILRPSFENELEALGLFEKFADQEVSFTDCTSFVLMRAGHINRAFAFDRHFEYAGFDLWPSSEP